VSVGRYRTSTGEDFVAMSARTFGVDNPSSLAAFRSGGGLTNAYPQVGPVVISEIMYRPAVDEGAGTVEYAEDEYLELYNFSADPVPLFDPDYPTNRWRVTDGVEFEFPPGVSLAAYGHLLIVGFDPVADTALLTAFRARYSVPEIVPVLGPFQGRLDNEGERLALSRPDRPQQAPQSDAGYVPYVEVEHIVYTPSAPWPVVAPGISLQRIAVAEYGNAPVNWRAAEASAGWPNPDAPRLVFEGYTAFGVGLSWSSVPGRTYRVQYKDDLDWPEWEELSGDVMATDVVTEAQDPAGPSSPRRYYRILVVD
jgi:hypothetical protein